MGDPTTTRSATYFRYRMASKGPRQPRRQGPGHEISSHLKGQTLFAYFALGATHVPHQVPAERADTIVYHIIEDDEASAAGTLNGTFNEMITCNGASSLETQRSRGLVMGALCRETSWTDSLPRH